MVLQVPVQTWAHVSNLSFKRLNRYTHIFYKRKYVETVCPFLSDDTAAKHWTCFVRSLQVTDKPVAVGFGISKPEHVKQVREVTITSSALLIKEWLILWISLTRPFRFRWTDCGVGCRWGDNWQCNGETVGWGNISPRRAETARGLREEHEERIARKQRLVQAALL